jgi:glucose/arabinose dehydrogenase
MNARMLIAATAATLFATMGTAAYAQEAQNDAQPPTAQQQQTADASAQASNDASYGGAKDGKSMAASGHRQGTCSAYPQCDIFFGQ